MVMETTKDELILAIQGLNRSASDEFLRQFGEAELGEYLASLRGQVRAWRPGSFCDAARQEAVAVA